MDTKKLRQKILDLAIRGKLVPQNPNDEPASVLLERIRAEKERLIKEGKIKRSKKSASDTPHYENVSFEVPEGWEWCQLDDLAFVTKLAGFEYTNYIADNLSKKDGIPLFKGKNVQDGNILYDFESYIPQSISNSLPRSQVSKKCLLTPYVGTIGNIGIHEREGIYHLGSNVGKIELFNENNINVYEEFVRYFLMSSYGYKELTKHKKATAQDSISIDAIRDVNIALPPTKEQKRIIENIQYWLSFVDEIGANSDAILNLVELSKSKILDLAIHGKLVPQDPNDEPAIELLKRINPSFVPCDNAHYENLPSSWIKVPLGNICTLNEGEPITDKEYPYIDVKGLRTGNYASKQSGKYVPIGTMLILVDGENSGEVFHTPVEGYQGSTMKVLDIANNMNAQYVLFFVMLYQKALRENKVGSAIPHLNKKMFRELVIPVPSIEEQERIVRAIQQRYRILDNISANL